MHFQQEWPEADAQRSISGRGSRHLSDFTKVRFKGLHRKASFQKWPRWEASGSCTTKHSRPALAGCPSTGWLPWHPSIAVGHFRTPPALPLQLSLASPASATCPHCHGSMWSSPGQMKKIKWLPLLVQPATFIPVLPLPCPSPKGPFHRHCTRREGPQPVSITRGPGLEQA